MATLNLQVSASTNDAFNRGGIHPGTGSYSATGANNNIGANSFFFFLVGARFTNVTIPQGSTITAASLQVCANANDSTQLDVTIAAENADSPGAFAGTTHEPYQAYNSKTTATVRWNVGTASWTAGSWYASADLTSVIQEIVNRAGWASGNAIVLVVYNTSTSLPGGNQFRVIRMWDYAGNASGMKLGITYTPPAAKVPAAMRSYRQRRAA